MKKILYILLASLCLTSCEDVIDVTLDTAEPRLVIDAALNLVRDTVDTKQSIILTLSAPFFNEDVPPATGAVVYVTDAFDNRFDFIEVDDTGIYENDSLIPEIDGTYTLHVIYNEETYTATEQFKSVTPIEAVEQKNDAGFSGDEIEFKAFYTDPADEENYYLYEFSTPSIKMNWLEVYNDEFTNGNRIFAFFSNEDIAEGDSLNIRSFGISERFYEYMNILLLQTDADSGDPFQTQPALLRGNCVNETNPENYPFGYFRVSEVYTFTYIVE